MMLNTNNQKSRASVSDKKIFLRFPYIWLCKTFDPRVGPFMAPGV